MHTNECVLYMEWENDYLSFDTRIVSIRNIVTAQATKLRKSIHILISTISDTSSQTYEFLMLVIGLGIISFQIKH